MLSLSAKDRLDFWLEEGKSVGKAALSKRRELSEEELEALTPNESKGKTFDGAQAKQNLEKTTYQHLESKGEQPMDSSVQTFITNADLNFRAEETPEDLRPIESIESCLIESTIEPVALHHILNVQVNYKPPITEVQKICRGHKSTEKSRNPKNDKHKKEEEFSKDPTIESYSVKIEDNGLGHRDYVVCRWTHKENTPNCRKFKENPIETSPARWEEIDTWQMERPELLDSLNCTLIKIENGSAETRTINGRTVSRPYWIKTHHLHCFVKKEKGCDFLNFKNCLFKEERCLKYAGTECVTLEKIYKCLTQTPRDRSKVGNLYGQDPNLWDKEYKPNTSFPNVATKLAVFDEMKQELENANVSDIRSFSLFKGIKEKCSVSVAETMLYDCCSGMDGFSTDIKLSKCTADEQALFESRRKGLVHYIGVKNETFMGLWNSRKEHIFCVFPSKLSRVFQEEARKQLGIDWGDASHPDCRGLTQEEIKQLDFTKLDLIEAFNLPKQEDNQERIRKIEERLKQRLEEM